MKQLIKTNTDLCEGCNRCVRECPMEMANITYLDEEGSIKVRIDTDKCIACGRCITACHHNARYFLDDTEQFFTDLANGVPISLMAAPAIRTNIPEHQRLFTYLKNLGVNKIYDVSLGADICTWAHIRYIQRFGLQPLITQPCPAIVSYCEMYKNELLENLSYVHSPMACASVLMKEYEGISDRIAVLSPCVAKSHEFESTGLADYNVTFLKLAEYLKENNIELPEEESDFDHYNSGIGSLYSMPGGLKENIEFFMGKEFHISKSEGFQVYERLDKYAEVSEMMRPDIFDVLNCQDGCNVGTACAHDKTIFEIDFTMDSRRKIATENRDDSYFEELYKSYDETFDLSKFLREYKPEPIHLPVITDEDIQKAFLQLDKDDDLKQHVDCGACGSETCYSMARKIALNVNIPLNCLVKSRDDVREIARKDPLTNIWNRRYFMELSSVQINRIQRTNGTGFFCMVDLDHFKSVNDTYGHAAGDQVLREVVERAKATIRSYDIFGRYGGEEFILFLLDMEKDNVLNVINRIRLAIAKEPVMFGDIAIPVTASFGVAYSAPIINEMDQAIKNADTALYEAKMTGRNKVVFFDIDKEQ